MIINHLPLKGEGEAVAEGNRSGMYGHGDFREKYAWMR